MLYESHSSGGFVTGRVFGRTRCIQHSFKSAKPCRQVGSSHLLISSAHLVCPARMFVSSVHLVFPARNYVPFTCSSRLPSSYVPFTCSSRLLISYCTSRGSTWSWRRGAWTSSTTSTRIRRRRSSGPRRAPQRSWTQRCTKSRCGAAAIGKDGLQCPRIKIGSYTPRKEAHLCPSKSCVQIVHAREMAEDAEANNIDSAFENLGAGGLRHSLNQ